MPNAAHAAHATGHATPLDALNAASAATAKPSRIVHCKSTPNIPIKAEWNGRLIDAYWASWKRDQVGDQIKPGAFKKTIEDSGPRQVTLENGQIDFRSRIKTGYNHGTIIGIPIDMQEDATGWRVISRIDDTELGNDVLKMCKSGTIDTCSFMYNVIQNDPTYDGGDTNLLIEIKAFEGGPVDFPANQAAAIIACKNNINRVREMIEREGGGMSLLDDLEFKYGRTFSQKHLNMIQKAIDLQTQASTHLTELCKSAMRESEEAAATVANSAEGLRLDTQPQKGISPVVQANFAQITIDGKTYRLTVNESDNGGVPTLGLLPLAGLSSAPVSIEISAAGKAGPTPKPTPPNPSTNPGGALPEDILPIPSTTNAPSLSDEECQEEREGDANSDEKLEAAEKALHADNQSKSAQALAIMSELSTSLSKLRAGETSTSTSTSKSEDPTTRLEHLMKQLGI